MKIFKLFSFFKFDVSFLIIFLMAIISGEFIFYGLFVIFIFFHELCHFFVAKKLGYFPQKIRISFFGASLEGYDDFLTNDEIKIVLAGPLFNLLIVVICYLSFWFEPETFEFLNDVLIVNKTLLLFNLLPIFPLDFGRLILCFLSKKFDRNKSLKIVKKLSVFVCLFLFFVSILLVVFEFDFTLGFASINLLLLLFDSTNGTSFKREIMFEKKKSKLCHGLVQKTIVVNENVKLFSLLKFLDSEHYFIFVLVDENFTKKKILSEQELLEKLGFI